MDRAQRPPAAVVWRRTVDHAAARQRWVKLGRYYGLPVAVVLVVGLILGGLGTVLGLLILLGLFALLLAGIVFFTNHNAAANASIELIDGHLVLGRQRVEIATITSWATKASAEHWDVHGAARGNPMGGNAITAKVLFQSAEGVQSFSWAAMPPEHLEQLRLALQPYIAAPLVSAEHLTGPR